MHTVPSGWIFINIQLHVLNPAGYPTEMVESVLHTELKHNLLNDREMQVGTPVRNLSHNCSRVFTSLHNFVA